MVEPHTTPSPRTSVVICVHPLLSEGIAAHLRARGIETTVVDCHSNPDGVAAALATRPTVVIAEWDTPRCRRAMAEISPGSTLIDVSSVLTRGNADADHLIDFDAILSALGVQDHAPA